MENSPSLAPFARRLRIAALAAAVAVPLLAVVALFAPEGLVNATDTTLPPRLGAGVALIAALLLAAGLVALATMLAEVAGGSVFGAASTRQFRRFARYLLLSVLAGIVLPLLAQVALIVFAGRRQLMFDLSDQDVIGLIVAALLFFVARLFDEAARLDEDSRSIV